jgi:hypothetical protein
MNWRRRVLILIQSDAKKIIGRMMAVFTYHNLGDDGVKNEYMKSLGPLDYKTCDRLIDKYRETSSRNLPAISEWLTDYGKLKEISRTDIVTDCKICGGKGFVPYKKSFEYNKKQIPTQIFIAYCSCTSGIQYDYDSSKCKDRRAEAATISVHDSDMKPGKRLTSEEIITELQKHKGILSRILPKATLERILTPKGDAYEYPFEV